MTHQRRGDHLRDDQMRDDAFDRELRGFLAWHSEDLAGAPSASNVAARISNRSGSRWIGWRMTPRPVWILLAGLLIAALFGALVVGSMQRHDMLTQLQDPPPTGTTNEAVFLRTEVVGDAPVVIAVGMDAAGHEREIARITDSWVPYSLSQGSTPKRKYLAIAGAVSPGGLLAIPHVADDGWLVHWEIIDLDRPKAQPIVVPGIEQDVEQIQSSPYFGYDMRPSVMWGPGERAAIPWYERLLTNEWHVAFVDGRTGATTSVPVPADVRQLPVWTTDGSGVFLGGQALLDTQATGILRADGSAADAASIDAVPSCRTRDRSGSHLVITDGRAERRDSDGGADEVLAQSGARFACFSPDDSTIVLTADVIGDPTTAPVTVTRVIDVDTGARHDVEGSFAGWMEVNGS